MTQNDLEQVLDSFYESVHDDPKLLEQVEKYADRHNIKSAGILTVFDDETADMIASYLSDRVQGKVVIEIGGGIGLLALHLSGIASKVISIEASPMWTSVWVKFLHAKKPKNVTWIFGSADEVSDMVQGDVAIFCTHSDHEGMYKAASMFAPEVIDVYAEIQNKEQ